MRTLLLDRLTDAVIGDVEARNLHAGRTDLEYDGKTYRVLTIFGPPWYCHVAPLDGATMLVLDANTGAEAGTVPLPETLPLVGDAIVLGDRRYRVTVASAGASAFDTHLATVYACAECAFKG
jgi:hypothetical protein